MVEDNPDDAKLITRLLDGLDAEPFAVTHTPTLHDALETLVSDAAFDIVLLDLDLPDSFGLATFERAHHLAPNVPIVILSGHHDPTLVTQALQAGAKDIIDKNDLNRPLITHVLRHAVLRHHADMQLASQKARVKASADALQESEVRFRQLAENVQEAFWMIDTELKVLYLSPAYATIYGRPIEQFYAGEITFLDIVHPDDRARVEASIAKQVRGRHEQEYRIVWPDGSVRWIWDRAFPVYDASGEVYRLAGVAADITERKQHEVERKRLLEDLAERIKELTTLHRVAGLLRDEGKGYRQLLEELVALLPLGWRRPQATAACVRVGELAAATEGFSPRRWLQQVDFETADGTPCSLAIAYLGDDESDPFLPEEYTLLRSLGEMLRAYLDNRHAKETIEALNATLTKRLTHLDALRQIDIAITSSLDLEVTLEHLVTQVQRTLEVDAVDIFLYDAALNRLQWKASTAAGVQGSDRARMAQRSFGPLALEREPTFMPTLQNANLSPETKQTLLAEGFVSLYALPLVAQGQCQGLLALFHRSPLETDSDWRDFAQALALQAAIAISSARLLEHLQRANADLALAYDETIAGWSRALDLKDEETAGHSQRVTDLTLRLAERLGMRSADLVHVKRGALLHDIGKMGVPDAILLKPGKLTPDEWEIMKSHTTFAYELLSPIRFLRQALDIPYAHHEKWDGSGYPRGLKGNEIPLAARIFAVVDVYDALTSDRPYRSAWREEEALAHIEEQAGRHFDPQVVEAFMALVREEARYTFGTQ
jgi:PAS domain S-box-containing protein/putative nucleotidyltransferase with HDIG domain